MVGASGPVRGPTPNSGQWTGKVNTGRDGGKKSDGAGGLVAVRDATSDPWRPPLDFQPNLSLNVIRYAARYAR